MFFFYCDFSFAFNAFKWLKLWWIMLFTIVNVICKIEHWLLVDNFPQRCNQALDLVCVVHRQIHHLQNSSHSEKLVVFSWHSVQSLYNVRFTDSVAWITIKVIFKSNDPIFYCGSFICQIQLEDLTKSNSTICTPERRTTKFNRKDLGYVDVQSQNESDVSSLTKF